MEIRDCLLNDSCVINKTLFRCFLISYILFMMVCGISLYFLEIMTSQFAGRVTWGVWDYVLCSKLVNSTPGYPTIDGGNDTSIYVSSVEEVWNYKILDISSGYDDIGTLNWKFILYVLACHVIIWLSLIKSAQSIGKMMYVTNIAPIVLTIVIWIRALLLPGATNGMTYFISPDFNRLAYSEQAMAEFCTCVPLWLDCLALRQMFKKRDDLENSHLYNQQTLIDRQKERIIDDNDKVVSMLESRNNSSTTKNSAARKLLRDDVNRKQTTIATEAGPIPILLVTYMRSGSSFVGNLLKANPKTFYAFEPLHMLQVDVRKQKPIRYFDGTMRNRNNFLKLSVDTIRDLSTCRMEQLPLSFYSDGFFTVCTDSSKFQLCMNGSKIENYLESGRKCSHILSKACQRSEYFVTKIIRMPIYALEPLLEKIPKLKIIHLLRDTRATVSSQVNAIRYTMGNLQPSVLKFCNRVYDDIVTREALERRYPSRLMTIEYEDIIKEPIASTNKLFQFSGMNFTRQVQKNILRLFSKTRKGVNFTVISSIWRTNPKMSVIKTVDDNCQQLYTRYGFKVLNEQDLKNVSVSLKLKSAPAFDDFRNE